MLTSRTFWITTTVVLGIAATLLGSDYSSAPVSKASPNVSTPLSTPLPTNTPILRGGPINENGGGCPQEPCPPDTQKQGGDPP